MRGRPDLQGAAFHAINLEKLVSTEHPLRGIRRLAGQRVRALAAVLSTLGGCRIQRDVVADAPLARPSAVVGIEEFVQTELAAMERSTKEWLRKRAEHRASLESQTIAKLEIWYNEPQELTSRSIRTDFPDLRLYSCYYGYRAIMEPSGTGTMGHFSANIVCQLGFSGPKGIGKTEEAIELLKDRNIVIRSVDGLRDFLCLVLSCPGDSISVSYQGNGRDLIDVSTKDRTWTLRLDMCGRVIERSRGG